MVRVWIGGRWIGLVLLLAAGGCGSGGTLPGAGTPAVGNSDLPMDLEAAGLRGLVWSIRSIPPPVPMDDALLAGLSTVPKGGADGAAKPLVGSECPVVELLNHDPDLSPTLPDPLSVRLVFERANGDRCVTPELEQAGTVEVSIGGLESLAGGMLNRAPGADLVMREEYLAWRREVPDAGGGTRTDFYGGSRTVTVDGTGPDAGVTRVTTDPWVTRRVEVRDAAGGVSSEGFYRYATPGLTAAPATGEAGPDKALRRSGTMTIASRASGFFEVMLDAVLYDPAVCGGTPTAGRMTFRAGGQTLRVEFERDYSQPFNCGLARVFRPGGTTGVIETFGTAAPVF